MATRHWGRKTQFGTIKTFDMTIFESYPYKIPKDSSFKVYNFAPEANALSTVKSDSSQQETLDSRIYYRQILTSSNRTVLYK